MSTPRSDRTYNRLLPRVGRQLPANDREQAKVYRGERDALRARVEAALAIHARTDYGGQIGCQSCVDPDEEPTAWPCPTAHALGVAAPQPESAR